MFERKPFIAEIDYYRNVRKNEAKKQSHNVSSKNILQLLNDSNYHTTNKLEKSPFKI